MTFAPISKNDNYTNAYAPKEEITFSSGSYASNAYLKTGGRESQLTFDWDCASIYFRWNFGEQWHTITLANAMNTGFLDSPAKVSTFKSLLLHTIGNEPTTLYKAELRYLADLLV